MISLLNEIKSSCWWNLHMFLKFLHPWWILMVRGVPHDLPHDFSMSFQLITPLPQNFHRFSPPVLQVPRPERTSRYRAGTARRALQDQAWLVRSVAMRCVAVRWGLTTAGLSDAVGWSFNGSIWGDHHKKKMQKKYTMWFQLGRVTYDLFGLESWGYYGMVFLELWQWRFLSTKIDAQKLGGASSFMGPGGTPK